MVNGETPGDGAANAPQDSASTPFSRRGGGSILAKKTILIVDDERRMADSLRDLLEPEGYCAQTAYNGAQAIELLRQKAFHVLVTDLRMQGIGGLDVLRYAHEHCPRTLIIVSTGHATTESAIEAVHHNVFDYLRKPFEFDLFRMAIEKAFHKIETDQLREDTAAMITHDIKAPLTSIIGFASMINDRETGRIHPRAAEFADTIQANGQKILALIENYLTSCKIDCGALRLCEGTVEPRLLLRDAAEVARPEAERQKREIRVSWAANLPAAVLLDEALMFRALSNLTHNAIKYSAGQTPIEISASRFAAAESPLGVETFCVSVTNDTQDILAEQLTEIFERYERGQHTGMDGCGLGLYVVRAVAQAHGGQTCAQWLPAGRIRIVMLLPLKIDESRLA